MSLSIRFFLLLLATTLFFWKSSLSLGVPLGIVPFVALSPPSHDTDDEQVSPSVGGGGPLPPPSPAESSSIPSQSNSINMQEAAPRYIIVKKDQTRSSEKTPLEDDNKKGPSPPLDSKKFLQQQQSSPSSSSSLPTVSFLGALFRRLQEVAPPPFSGDRRISKSSSSSSTGVKLMYKDKKPFSKYEGNEDMGRGLLPSPIEGLLGHEPQQQYQQQYQSIRGMLQDGDEQLSLDNGREGPLEKGGNLLPQQKGFMLGAVHSLVKLLAFITVITACSIVAQGAYQALVPNVGLW